MRGKTGIHHAILTCFRKALHGVLAVLIFVGLFSILGQEKWSSYAIGQYTGTDSYQEPNWSLSAGNQVLEEQVQLPAFRELEKGREYVLSTVLTYDGSRDNLPHCFFYIHHMHCSAYLDGEKVLSYMPQDLHKRDNAKSPGNIHVGLPLPKDCQGKRFEIHFVPALDAELDYELPFAFFGDYPTMYHSRFFVDLPHNLIAILVAFLGAVAIIISAMALQGREYREGTFIGIFALIFSTYSLTECPFNLYLISNPYYVYLVNYTSFSLMPVAMMAFLREKFTKTSHKNISLCLVLGGLGILVTEWVLHFRGILDMREFLKVIHGEYFVDLVFVLGLVLTMEPSRHKKALVLQMIPLALGTVMDLMTYYFHWDLARSDAPFSTIGIVVFLLIEIRYVWRSSIEIYMESIRSHYYQEMAYEDKLTGVGNRRAFEAEKMELYSGVQKYRTIHVASADVNDLKQVNDTRGHAEGDYLIKSTARVLADMTKDCGKTFRTGGDEFVLMFYDVTEAEIDDRMARAKARVNMFNETGHAHLSIAIGVQKVEDLDIESAVQTADRKMYVDKSQKKEYPRD